MQSKVYFVAELVILTFWVSFFLNNLIGNFPLLPIEKNDYYSYQNLLLHVALTVSINKISLFR